MSKKELAAWWPNQPTSVQSSILIPVPPCLWLLGVIDGQGDWFTSFDSVIYTSFVSLKACPKPSKLASLVKSPFSEIRRLMWLWLHCAWGGMGTLYFRRLSPLSQTPDLSWCFPGALKMHVVSNVLTTCWGFEPKTLWPWGWQLMVPPEPPHPYLSTSLSPTGSDQRVWSVHSELELLT